MFTPVDDEPEWIELYNNSNDTINIKNWTITDIFTTPVTSKICTGDLYFLPGHYLVLAKDSSIIYYHRVISSEIIKMNLPVLNNDVDGIILKDNRGITIDSVKYSQEMTAGNGCSLERYSTEKASTEVDNWKSSVDIELSTPGRLNSITEKQYDLLISSISCDPKFPVPGDEIRFQLRLKITD